MRNFLVSFLVMASCFSLIGCGGKDDTEGGVPQLTDSEIIESRTWCEYKGQEIGLLLFIRYTFSQDGKMRAQKVTRNSNGDLAIYPQGTNSESWFSGVAAGSATPFNIIVLRRQDLSEQWEKQKGAFQQFSQGNPLFEIEIKKSIVSFTPNGPETLVFSQHAFPCDTFDTELSVGPANQP